MKVTAGWRRLHNEELHNLYASQSINSGDQSKVNKMVWVCTILGRDEECIQHFDWKN
jgi:hypothetical protein